MIENKVYKFQAHDILCWILILVTLLIFSRLHTFWCAHHMACNLVPNRCSINFKLSGEPIVLLFVCWWLKSMFSKFLELLRPKSFSQYEVVLFITPRQWNGVSINRIFLYSKSRMNFYSLCSKTQINIFLVLHSL